MNSAEFRAALFRRSRHAGVTIVPDLAELLEQYFRLLARWNVKINLTSLPLAKPTDDTFDRLLIEPVRVALELEAAPKRWFDLGSGGGSPAIPMKLTRPMFDLTMVESKVRKAAFLRDAIRQLSLERTVVENSRFEMLVAEPSLERVADLVTVRAVRVDEPLLQACRYLLREGGELVLFGFTARKLSGFNPTARIGRFERQCST